MSKQKTTTPQSSAQGIAGQRMGWIYGAILALAVMVFLGKAIFGNGFGSSDNIASNSFRPYLQEAAKNGEFPQWMPYIFSGMPSYAALLTTGERTWDFVSGIVFTVAEYFGKIFGSDVARIAFWYILYAVGMYLLMRTKKHEQFTSFFTAFAAVFSTWVITWVMIGHNTKPVAFSMIPYVLMCLEKVREKWSLLYAVLMVVAVHVMIESTHLQMAFYGICTFGLYLLFELITRVITKQEPMGVVRAAAVLAVAGGLSYSMASDRFMSTQEYLPYSTRGSAPISQLSGKSPEAKKGQNVQDVNGGNDYDYATGWSFSPEEVSTFFVANFYGFGKLEYKGPLTGNKATVIGSYYGNMAFTDAANYMGMGVLLLAIFGVWFYRRDVFVQFLVALSLFSLFLSFGKNLSFLYDFFFYHVPGFNKFRAPSMALAMMQFAVPVLAAYGLSGFIQLRNSNNAKEKKVALYFVGTAALYLVFGLFYTTVMGSGFTEAVAASDNFKQYQEGVRTELAEWVFQQMRSDWMITGVLTVLTGVLVWMFANKKLGTTVFYGGMALLLVLDLWRVDFRAMEIPKQKIEKDIFAKNDLIDFLKQDNSIYRVSDLQAIPGGANVAAYHKIENTSGYHSAKMRVYQDLLDEAGNGGGQVIMNPLLWNMMNVKYILSREELYKGVPPQFTSQATGVKVYQNPTVLPRAFFVNHAVVANKTEILAHLKNGDFNPVDTCFVEEAIPATIEPADSTAKATFVERKNEHLKLDVTASGNNLLFLSEVYYPVSWKVKIDGQDAKMYKTNFAFRSVVIPKGKHTLEFTYVSEGFQTGKTLSLGANLLVLAGALGAAFMEWKKRKSPVASTEAA